ncbi:MAG: tRNA lysidine(34) synthetase TilS [Chitinophagales bacterium]|nr:tRNA lysidine(34) synthetase TilS [Chitinophagales bacterium]
MTELFIKTLKKLGLFHPNSITLIGVSGGLDSMVLCHLYFDAGLPFAIAHYNYKLRGEESEADAEFVKERARYYKVAFHLETANTEKYAKDHKVSIQEAARDLRYSFFEKLRIQHKYEWIAVAHHRDDNIETVFQNIIKGTGIDGLSGMQMKRDKIIRPMLEFSRVDLLGYVSRYNLQYRDDSSNKESKYERNYLRNEILPTIDNWQPSFRNVMQRNIANWQEMAVIYKRQIKDLKKKYTEQRGIDLYIHTKRLLDDGYGKVLLFELTNEYGFNPTQVEDILDKHESGKQILSENYRMIRDRNFLILTLKDEIEDSIEYIFDKEESITHLGKKIRIKCLSQPFTLDTSGNILQLDKSKLEFPLMIRSWKQGDYFYPLGMTKGNSEKRCKKKVSDYFIDKKVPLHEKEKTSIILSGGKICGIIGYQVDDRFKVQPSTQDMIKIEII